MRKSAIFTSIMSILLGLVIFTACNKNKEYETTSPGSYAHFTGATLQTYSIPTATTGTYTVTVGTTDVSAQDRTVTFNVTSPTGAVKGTQYTLSVTGNTVVIPAGQATADIKVQGVYSQYTSGRKDTLVFSLSSPSMDPAKFQDTVKLALRGGCFEGDVILNNLKGTWAHTVETLGTGAPYGPYTTTISAVNQLTPTTGTVTVTNIWDNGWSPITFTLDWTDPNNRTAIVVPQTAIGGSNAGDLNSAYAGQTVAVRAFAGNPGTFSVCNNTLTLRMQLGVTGVGYFASLYTVNLAR
jgi:hypothetical protein